MQILEDPAWVRGLSALGLVIMFCFLLFAAWWALFSDRPKGRRRCPRCWYELTYSPSMTCPECGFTAQYERQLEGRRRRPVIALLAILGCTTIGLLGGDHLASNGIVSLVPTWGLTAVMPLVDDTRGSVFSEVARRIRTDELTNEQWTSLLERCVRGDAGARPPSNAWIAKYEDFTNMGLRRSARSSDLPWKKTVEDLLRTLPPRVTITAAEEWPEHVGPTLDVRARTWWPRGAQCRIRAEPAIDGAAPDVHVLRDAPIQRRSYSILLPPLPAGRHEIDVRLSIDRRADAASAWSDAGAQVIPVKLLVAGTLDERLTPVRGPEYDDVIRDVFRQGLASFQGGSLPVRVRVDQQATAHALFRDIAIAVRAEVYRNGRLGRQLDIWWLGGVRRADRAMSWEVPWHDDAVLGAPEPQGDEWTIRVRSMPELALRLDGVTHYWAGEVVVRAPVREQPNAAPARGWISADAPEVDATP